MRFPTGILVLLTLFGTFLYGRDEEKLALINKAQADFDRVALSVSPSLSDTATCAQSQAALLPVSTPEEQSAVHYHKGYCLLAGATITNNQQDYSAAAAEFDRSIEAWPARIRKPAKNAPPEPVSSGLRVLAALAHANAEGETAARMGLAAAVTNPSCNGAIMQESACRQWVEIGRERLGRMALRSGNLTEAASYFSGSTGSGWQEWTDGKQAFQAGNFRHAVERYAAAIETWKTLWAEPGPGFQRRMGPHPDLSAALTELGGAQLVASNPTQAIATLDSALKLDPAAPRAFYLRARAREVSGRVPDALADYNLAARAAFAVSEDLVSGEAHLYRGILYFRRKDFARAEDEFSSALNFSIADALRPDAEAWRHLAAVASGSCATARQNLAQSLANVSPFFPKDEARSIAATCPTSANVSNRAQ